MRHFWILLLLLTITFQNSNAQFGENKNYRLISSEKYQLRIDRNKDILLRRYIVVPAFDKNKKLIFITNNPDSILIGAATLLRKGKSYKVLEYIQNCNQTENVNNLIAGLYWLSKNNYEKAHSFLLNMEIEKHNFLQLLLIADCEYELNRTAKQNAIISYQKAYDIATNENERQIIRNRIKFIKYQ